MFRDQEWNTTTTAASPGEFIKIFRELCNTTRHIICILVSKAMTATQESAYLARKMSDRYQSGLNIEIIDSRCFAGAMGFMVLEAARAAKAARVVEK
jgi:fatty acid-binding protein DegV